MFEDDAPPLYLWFELGAEGESHTTPKRCEHFAYMGDMAMVRQLLTQFPNGKFVIGVIDDAL